MAVESSLQRLTRGRILLLTFIAALGIRALIIAA